MCVPGSRAYRRGMTTHLHEVPLGRDDMVVEMRDLTKRFGGRTAVDAVDLEVPRGVAFGYLGPNGAGKTTLMRMLLGLTPASSGEMRLLGLPLPQGRAGALACVGAIVELKLRRRRGLVAVTALLTVGAMKHVLHSRSRLRPPLLRNSAPGAGCYMGKTFSDGLNSQPITVFACPI
jgi:energy-coupling factor transporter ATP-binding protein EcfA2